MIKIDGETATENENAPWHHVPLKDGLTPFDWQAWKEDEAYRENIKTNYRPDAPGDLPRVYEEDVAKFVARSGVQTAYRAIRIRSQTKNFANHLLLAGGEKNVTADPEGGTTGLFADASGVMARMGAYQRMDRWPEDVPICPVRSDAAVLPIQHVSGDNYATQYISCALDAGRARFCSLTSYTAGTMNIRRAYEWAPVVQLDLTRFPADCKVVDLRSAEMRLRAGFFQSDPRSLSIGSLAEADQEILLTGVIPGAAVVKVFTAVEVVRMAEDRLRDDAIRSDGLKTYSKRPDFQHLAALYH